MNLFYSVGRGSLNERAPRLVVVEYRGSPEKEGIDIAIVGKGISFDTGGLNMKGTPGINDMYTDKGGACVTMGTLQGVLDLKIKKNIVFGMAFSENSVGPNSSLPLDIITAMNGLTVQIGNTDAEGRLVLSDSFTYIQRQFKPERLVDLATLTGAVRIALGNQTAGLFSNDDEFAKEIRNSGL